MAWSQYSVGYKVDVKVKVDEGATQRMLKSPNGPVGVYAKKMANHARDLARANAPTKTGKLRKSITVTTGVAGNSVGMEIWVNTSYAMAVVEGRRARTIYPRKKQVLKFPGKGGGEVFARKVKQGPVKGNTFLQDALNNTVSTMA